jgi:lipoprotein-releasing system ATP-binding protein
MGEAGTNPLEARDLKKHFVAGDGSELRILQGVDLQVRSGEVVAVVGASGVGKSTLLHLLGALDKPTGGEVLVGGRSLSEMDAESTAGIRNRHIGFVFQFHHLLRDFTALENVAFPRRVGGASEEEAEETARSLLDSVGLSRRYDHVPTQLSGGEQQRVAVARALANDPLVLLADEPSGNLDASTSSELHELLFRLREEKGTSMVLVTHNLALAGQSDRILELRDGVLHDDVIANRAGEERAGTNRDGEDSARANRAGRDGADHAAAPNAAADDLEEMPGREGGDVGG